MDEEDLALIVSRCMENLEQEERNSFKNAIYLAPTWKKANEVLVDYLKNTLTAPIAKLRAKMTSKHPKNC